MALKFTRRSAGYYSAEGTRSADGAKVLVMVCRWPNGWVFQVNNSPPDDNYDTLKEAKEAADDFLRNAQWDSVLGWVLRP